ncbi:PH domain-containing protein [Spirillospora sp. CA-294931]|uniref:PH domain-containing protein n=1 Tax=Spirillospora sp. CA-294931 TaxID=3240042 RepID=UPI003D8D6D95
MNASHGEPPYEPPAPQGEQPPPGHVPAGPPPMAPYGPQGGPAYAPQIGALRQYPADQAFAPGGGLAWSHISKRYTFQRLASAVLWAVPVGLIGGFLVSRGGGILGASLWTAAVVISIVLAWIIAEMAYRAYGFAERGDDLLVMHGVFVKRLIVVPYGRMQFVDVTAGLLERWMGIATVRMHTAAAATDALIPGLPAAEAAMLRDRLAKKGEERSMGL